jgi:tight adherence protein C
MTAGVLVDPTFGAMAGAGVLLAGRVARVVAARRRRAAVHRQLPDAIDLVVLVVRAGLTPLEAVREVATVGPPSTRAGFREVVRRTERGQPFAEALAALVDELGPSAAPIVELIAAADRYGVALTTALDDLTRDARFARRRADEADARKLAVRLSFPLVACTLPSFVLLAIAPAVIAALSTLTTTEW